MTGIFWRKIWRDLVKNLSRSLLVILSIAVGGIAVGMIAAVQQELGRALNTAYTASSPAHTSIWAPNESGFDQEAVEKVSDLPGVKAAEGRTVMVTRARVNRGIWRDFVLFALPEFDQLEISRVQPESGTWPPPRKSIFLERAVFTALEVEIGDVLSIQSSEGQQTDLLIAGSVHDPSRGSLAIGEQAAGYISTASLAALGVPAEYSVIHIQLENALPARERIRETANRAGEVLQDLGYSVASISVGTPGHHPFNDSMQTMFLVLTVFSFLALLMSGTLIVNTITAILVQEVPQIGALKAIGGQRRQIIRLYLQLVLAHSVLALLIALPVSLLAAYLLTLSLGSLFNIDIIDFRFPASAWGIQALVCLLLPLIFSLGAVRGGTRLTVSEALSRYGGYGGFTLSLPRLGQSSRPRKWSARNPLSVLVQLSLQNVLQRRQRTGMTFITLLLAGLLFVSVLSLYASQMKLLDQTLAPLKYDVQIDLIDPTPVDLIAQSVEKLEGVTRIEGWNLTSGSILSGAGKPSFERMRIVGLPPETSMIAYPVLEGRWLNSSDQNAIVIDNIIEAENPGIGINSQIVLEIGGIESIWQVVGITRVIGQPGAYVNLTGGPARGNAGSEVNRAYLSIEADDTQGQGATARAAEQMMTEAGIGIRAVTTLSEVRAKEALGFNLIRYFLLGMVSFVGIIGGLSLSGMLAINVVERAHEIGVLRAVGASNAVLRRIVFFEAIWMIGLTWFSAILLSIPVSRVLIQGIATLTGERLPYTLPGTSLLMLLGAMLILAVLATLVPVHSVARISVRKAITGE